jgi:predicted amidohydrolase YtcJ
LRSTRYKKIINCRLVNSREHSALHDIEIDKGKITNVVRHAKSTLTSSQEDYDAKGNLVIPAFIDCHCHLFALGEKAEEVDLRNCISIEEMLERIRNFVRSSSLPSQNSDRWVFGRGWDQERFEDKRFPNRHDIDAGVGRFPAVMTRVCGHIAVANTLAMKFFESRGNLQKFDRALVPKESSGNPSGIIKENALASCWLEIPKPSISQLEKHFLLGQAEALRYGLCAVHCILDNFDQLRAIIRLDKEKRIELKLLSFLPIDALPYIEKMSPRRRKEILKGLHYHVLGFKIFTDGSLGARTAALSEDYSDDQGNSGILNYSDDKLVDYAKRVKRLGMILATHAIGDRAVEQTVRCFAEAGIRKRHGFRIEHASIIRHDLFGLFSNVIISIQPMFSASDFWINERIGEDGSRRLAYPFKTLREHALLVVGGSDSPVESIDPLTGIGAATSNRINTIESLPLKNALELYTKCAAKLSPLTKNSGIISKGRDCDIVVFKADHWTEVENLSVEQLFIDGVAIPSLQRLIASE